MRFALVFFVAFCLCKYINKFVKNTNKYVEKANKYVEITYLFECQTIIFMNMDVLKNIREIRIEKSINQDVIASALDVDTSAVSNIENGKRELKVSELAKIANCLGVEVLDLFTYPEKYVNIKSLKQPERISVTFEVSPDKREHLLRMVTGDSKLEVLKK